MNRFIAGATFYIVLVWIIIIVPLFIAGTALLIMGIKDLKSKKKTKKKAGPIVCTVIGAIFFIVSSTAIIAPLVWWVQYYDEAAEADERYKKSMESEGNQPEESEEVNSEEVYLIY